MIEPYQLFVDVWEGNPDLDYATLVSYGVAGAVVRLNDMSGGHHMDTAFIATWLKVKIMPCRALYFVYNPWVDGKANYAWLAAHVPADFNSRIYADVEVKYPNYSPDAYANEVAIFVALCKTRWPISIYTGQGFLSTLTTWPKDVDYWWAAYPNNFNTGESISWPELHNRLDAMAFAYNGATCPGGKANIKAHQFSGGGVILPGFGTHKVDLSVFPGTLTDLQKWMGPFGAPLHTPIEDVPSDADKIIALANNVAALSDSLNSIADALETIATHLEA